MGNIGSEVCKAFVWKNKDRALAQEAAERVLVLIDLTVTQRKQNKGVKEILKLREVFCDCFFDFGNFKVKPKSLKRYFIPFALSARKI